MLCRDQRKNYSKHPKPTKKVYNSHKSVASPQQALIAESDSQPTCNSLVSTLLAQPLTFTKALQESLSHCLYRKVMKGHYHFANDEHAFHYHLQRSSSIKSSSLLLSICLFSRPLLVGWRPSLVISWRPFLLGWRPSLLDWRPQVHCVPLGSSASH